MDVGTSFTAEPRASAFVAARLAGKAITDYPGAYPTDLDEAYLIQDHAISLWQDEIAGWKVGRINEPYAAAHGSDRLVGPIFRGAVRSASPDSVTSTGFAGGFIAVEGEYVIVTRCDAPRDKTDFSLADARDLVGAVRVGIEIASSPFSRINDLGPLVTISDFGNNQGLITGVEAPDWEKFDLENWIVSTRIDGREVGRGVASSIPGGPLESFRFCLENCARRGHFLSQGTLVSTGAVSGVHPIEIGQSAIVSFAGAPSIQCHITAASPA
jgi:2-keto-4-pentenoate hydratase